MFSSELCVPPGLISLHGLGRGDLCGHRLVVRVAIVATKTCTLVLSDDVLELLDRLVRHHYVLEDAAVGGVGREAQAECLTVLSKAGP